METSSLIATSWIRRRTRRVFFGWWIVLGAAVNQGLFSLLYYQSFGAYLVLFRDEFGWSRGALSGAYSMARLESSIVAPLQGWLLDKVSPRSLMRIGVIAMAVGFFTLSQVHTLWTYYAAFMLIAVGSSLSGFLTIQITVARWFVRNRTIALSMTMIGGTVGGLGAPLLAWSLENWGWRDTAIISGVLILLVCLPLAQLMRSSPEAYGQRPDGDLRVAGDPHETGVNDPLEGFTAKQALRTRAFWLLGGGHGLSLLTISVINSQLIIHLVDLLKLSVTAAATVFVVILGTQLVSQAIGGIVGDRYNKRLIAAATMLGHATAMLMLAMSSAMWLIVVAAMIHGAAWGFRGPLMTAIRAEYFGRRSLGTILGLGTTFAMIGSTVGPVFAGLVVDITGSYRPAFYAIAVLVSMGSVLFLLAAKPKLPEAA
jgi:MFS family permease